MGARVFAVSLVLLLLSGCRVSTPQAAPATQASLVSSESCDDSKPIHIILGVGKTFFPMERRNQTLDTLFVLLKETFAQPENPGFRLTVHHLGGRVLEGEPFRYASGCIPPVPQKPENVGTFEREKVYGQYLQALQRINAQQKTIKQALLSLAERLKQERSEEEADDLGSFLALASKEIATVGARQHIVIITALGRTESKNYMSGCCNLKDADVVFLSLDLPTLAAYEQTTKDLTVLLSTQGAGSLSFFRSQDVIPSPIRKTW